MAEPTVDFEATNLFGLNANFNTQTSSSTNETVNVATNDELGNVACQRNIGGVTRYTQNATYCGADFIGDLGTFLTEFGNVQNSILVESISIGMSAEGYATVDITGHQHDENTHVAGIDVGYADVSDFLPHEVGEAFEDWDGFGVPDFGITLGDNATPQSATVSFTMNHIDKNDPQGDHFIGKSITPRCELNMDFIGIPTSNTATLLEADFDGNTNDMLDPLVDSVAESDSNSDFETFSFTAHANTTLETSA